MRSFLIQDCRAEQDQDCLKTAHRYCSAAAKSQIEPVEGIYTCS